MPSYTANIWAQLRNAANNDVWNIVGSGAPTSGTSGTGVGLAGPGSMYADIGSGSIYVNTNTKASPTWTVLASSSGGTITGATISSSTIDNTNTVNLKDTLFRLQDDGDATKQVAWQLSSITTATTRTITVPDSDLTLVGVATTQTLTNKTLTAPTLTTPALGVATGTSLAVTGLITSSSPSAGIGYATGAGGASSQSTDKSTTVVAVPNPSLSGTITMNNAALNAGVIVSFTFTNSAIAAGDVLVLNHKSGGTIGPYLLNAQAGAGSATINVRNTSAGNLSDAIVIQFVIIKGVSA